MTENKDSVSYEKLPNEENIKDYFNEYLRRKFPIIPVNGEKKPIVKWEEYQKERPNKIQILKWAGKHWGDWAIICGHDNLICIDCDDPNLYFRYLSNFSGMVLKTPSGGINFFVKSIHVPESSTNFNGYALDIRGNKGLAVVPIEDHDRKWICFHEPEEVEDIMKILEERLESLTTKYEIGDSCIDYIKKHADIKIDYEGHGYVQILCPWHNETKASCTIYKNRFKCFGCGKKGGLFELIMQIEGITEDEILEKYNIKKQDIKINNISRIVDIVVQKLKENEEAQLVYDKNDNPMLWIKVNDHYELVPFSGKGFKNMIHQEYKAHYGTYISNSILKEAEGAILATAETITQAKTLAANVTLHSRFIRGPNGEIVYDIRDEGWLGVKITQTGWNIIQLPLGVCRTDLQISQVYPMRSGNDFDGIEQLLGLFRLRNEDDELLIKACICTAIINDIQHPIVWFVGGQGSGKSKQSQFVASIIDPKKSNVQKMPDDIRNLAVILNSSRCTVFDNMNKPITDEQSDVLCMAITGGSLEYRSLYENEKPYLLNLEGNNIVLNSHYVHRNAPDLIDRAIIFHVRPMEEDQIKSESDLDKEFAQIKPKVMASIFTSLSKALQIIPTVEKEAKDGKFKLERMSDFTIWGEALARVWDYEAGNFAKIYSNKRNDQTDEILESNPLAEVVIGFTRHFWEMNNKDWVGSPDKMLQELNGHKSSYCNSDNAINWPASPRALTARLAKIEVDLRRKGVVHTYSDKTTRINGEPIRPHRLKWMLNNSTVTSENQAQEQDVW